MPTPIRLLAVAALVAAALGGVLLLGGNLNQPPEPKPAPSPPPTSAADLQPIESGPIDGNWVSYSPAVFGSQAGDYTMTLTSTPSLMVKGPDGRDIFLGLLDNKQPEGRAILRKTDQCPDAGTYTYALSDDFRHMTFEQVSDSCADRAKLLASSWVRTSIDDAVAVDQRYAVDLDPQSRSWCHPNSALSAGVGKALVPVVQNEGLVVIDAEDEYAIIHTRLHAQTDRCDQTRGHRSMPASFADFLEWNRAATGVTVSEPVATTVGDRRRLCRCDAHCGLPERRGPTELLLHPDDALVIGMIDRIWAVDVNGKIVLIQFHDDNPPWLEFTPERQAIGQEFVDSISFE